MLNRMHEKITMSIKDKVKLMSHISHYAIECTLRGLPCFIINTKPLVHVKNSVSIDIGKFIRLYNHAQPYYIIYFWDDFIDDIHPYETLEECISNGYIRTHIFISHNSWTSGTHLTRYFQKRLGNVFNLDVDLNFKKEFDIHSDTDNESHHSKITIESLIQKVKWDIGGKNLIINNGVEYLDNFPFKFPYLKGVSYTYNPVYMWYRLAHEIRIKSGKDFSDCCKISHKENTNLFVKLNDTNQFNEEIADLISKTKLSERDKQQLRKRLGIEIDSDTSITLIGSEKSSYKYDTTKKRFIKTKEGENAN